MKKLLIYALLLALVLALPVVAGAQEPVRDSSYIEPEILAQLDMTDADRVVKAFQVDVMKGFSNFKSIEMLLTQYRKEVNYIPDYMVLAGDTALRIYKQDESGQLSEMELKKSAYQMIAAEYVNHGAIKRLGEDVEIRASYLLLDSTGSVIYYETSKGSFVYKPGRDQVEYLMPLKDFSWAAHTQVMFDWCMERSGGWSLGFPAVLDCSGFNIHAEDFDMQFRYKSNPVANAMWIIAFVVGGSALLATHLIKKRRSLRQQEGPRMKPDPTPRYAYCFHIL